MAGQNQATITLAVNVTNLQSLRRLNTSLFTLRRQIIGMQRNPALRNALGDPAALKRATGARVAALRDEARMVRARGNLAAAQIASQRTLQRENARTTAQNVKNQSLLRTATTTANTAIIRSQANLQAAQSRASAMQVRASAQMRTALAQQVRSHASLRAAQAAGIRVAAQLQNAHQRMANSLGRLVGAHSKAQRAAKNHASGLRGWARALEEAEVQLDAVWRASFRLQMLGSDLRRMGEILIGGLKGAADEFGEFEFMANRAAGALGIFGQDSEFAEVTTRDLQAAILDTSQELRLFPAEDVAKAVYFWGSTTGQAVESQENLRDVLGSLIPVMQTAALTEVTYESAIKGLYSILTQYEGGILDAAQATGDFSQVNARSGEIMEQLFYITQKTAVEFDDLIQSFKMVGPIAASVGVSFEDMVQLMGRLGDLGIRGTMAGRSFRQMFMRLAAPPGPAMAALKELFASFEPGSEQFAEFGGRSYMDVMFPEGQFVGTEKMIKNFALAVKDMNTQQKVAFLTKFSTANLLPTMIALIDAETRKTNQLGEEISKTGASQEEMGRIFERSWGLLRDSWKGTVGAFERAMESLRITVGSGIAEAFKPFLEVATDVIQKIRDWVRDNPELVQQLAKLTGMMGGALIAAGALFTALGGIVALIAGFRMAIAVFVPLLGKWTLFGGLVGSVVDAIVRNWDTLVERFAQVKANIVGAIENIMEVFGGTEGAAKDLGSAFRTLGDLIVEHVSNAAVVISNLVWHISRFKPLFELFKVVGIPVITQFISLLVAAKILSFAASLLTLNRVSGRLHKLWSGPHTVQTLTNLQKYNTQIQMIGGPAGRGAAVSVTGLSAAFGRLSAGIKGFAASNPHLVFLAIAAGFGAAYEQNWGGFKHLVDELTGAFRNLDNELRETFENIDERNAAVDMFARIGEEGGIVFRDAVKEKVGSDWFLSLVWGGNEGLYAGRVKEATDDLWTDWTYGARDAKEATANVTGELNKLGLDVQTWSEGFGFALDKLTEGMHPSEKGSFANIFGIALAESLRNGSASVDEMTQNLAELTGNAAWATDIMNGLTDAQLRNLGVTTRHQEAVEKTARTLMANLSNTAFGGGLFNTGVMFAELSKLQDKVGPELAQEIADFIANYTEAGVSQGAEEGLANGFAAMDAESALRQGLADIGIAQMPTDMFSDMLKQLQTAAAADVDGIIDWPAVVKGVLDGSSEALEKLDDWIIPELDTAASGLADAIKTAFSGKKNGLKQSFHKALKSVIPDKKGIKRLLSAWYDPKLAASLRGEFGIQGRALGLIQVQEVTTGFNNAWAVATPQQRTNLVTQFTDIYNLSEADLAAMEPTMRDAAVIMMAQMYAHMKRPVPQWLVDYITGQMGNVPVEAQAELDKVDLTMPDITVPDTAPVFDKYFDLTTYINGLVINAPTVNDPEAPDTTPVTSKIGAMVSYIWTQLGAINRNAAGWGQHLVEKYAWGIESREERVRKASRIIATAAGSRIKMSMPPPGPLFKVREWGKHLVENYTDPIFKNAYRAEDATSMVAARAAKGFRSELASLNSDINAGMEYSTSNKRVVEIHVVATSPDGGVNRMQLSEIRKGVLEGLALSEIEHMITVE